MLKIIKYLKKNNNLYEITLSNGKIDIYDDVILKYKLLLRKEISEKELDNIIQDNNYYLCYYKCLKLLNKKMYTEKQLVNKLKSFDNNSIKFAINKLKIDGYIDDSKYIKSYINDQVNLKLSGPNKIKNELLLLGFKDNQINDYLNSVESSVWLDRIEKIINKKIKVNHNYSGIRLKQNIINYLINNGYEMNDINTIINEYQFQDNIDIYNKEYKKLKNKLSKKYASQELEYQVKQELWKKGFRN